MSCLNLLVLTSLTERGLAEVTVRRLSCGTLVTRLTVSMNAEARAPHPPHRVEDIVSGGLVTGQGNSMQLYASCNVQNPVILNTLIKVHNATVLICNCM